MLRVIIISRGAGIVYILLISQSHILWLVVLFLCCHLDLLKEYCEWLPESCHQAVTAIWPPDRKLSWSGCLHGKIILLFIIHIPCLRRMWMQLKSKAVIVTAEFRMKKHTCCQLENVLIYRANWVIVITHLPLALHLVSIPGSWLHEKPAWWWRWLLQELHKADCAYENIVNGCNL